MHSVDLLEEALQFAEQAGFEIRREWLGESTGGACRIGPKWVLFVDLSLPAHEQLMQVAGALKAADFIHTDAGLSPALRSLLL